MAPLNQDKDMDLTSAAGILSLLNDSDRVIQRYALERLNDRIDIIWPEVSDHVQQFEILHENKSEHQYLAALVASKIYYHLGSYPDAVHYALCAGQLFDVNSSSQYVQTIIGKCIDQYIEMQQRKFDAEDADTEAEVAEGEEKKKKKVPVVDKEDVERFKRLEDIVNRMVKMCFADKQYKRALGLALDVRRQDILLEALNKSDDVASMLAYTLDIALTLTESRKLRDWVLRVLVNVYRTLDVPDYVNMCQCFIFLNDPDSVSTILQKLSKGNEESNLMAYQIAFDMYESATQQFIKRVIDDLKLSAPIPSAMHTIVPTFAPPPEPAPGSVSAHDALAEAEAAKANAERAAADKVAIEKQMESLTPEGRQHQDHVQKIVNILSGEVSIDIHLQFLIRTNKTDMLILKNTKDSIRVTICHTATIIANGFMHAGTTSDQFLRDNLEWLSRATNWAKLTATASLGVIHHGHEHEALSLMQSYLPRETGPSSGYSEGGGLYALGLIHANHGTAINDYLLQQLKDAQNEVVRHGGCLGLGLSAMSTNRLDIYEQLRFNLYQDDAVTGEAAALGMGLVMIGSKSLAIISDMTTYANDTQHEKIMRGLAVGIALVMYGSLEDANGTIEGLCADKDPVLRRSGMYTIAMAFCGTASNAAIRKLLHFAVSDVSDDVRRAAVTCLGFLLCRQPEQCPSVVSLLSESYNPHVRYGAAMALGIACAGTGLKEAIALLEPLTNDSVNFVRQGALIASAMVLVQQTEGLCPKMKDFRALYVKVITDKHEDVMAKFGAILAQGIIDAGGRNVTIGLESRTGHVNMKGVAGMLLFLQHWYWYPLANCLTLSFVPTCVIGLNSFLKMPKIQYRSNAKPSLFGYVQPLEEKKKDDKERVTSAVLSYAARAKKKGTIASSSKHHFTTTSSPVADGVKVAEKMDVSESADTAKVESVQAKGGEKMDVDECSLASSKEIADKAESAKTVVEKDDAKVKDDKKEKEEKKPEPNFEILENPARVMKQQLKHLSLVENCVYSPIKKVTVGGIIMMKREGILMEVDTTEELVEPVAAMGPKKDTGEEAPKPSPFEYFG